MMRVFTAGLLLALCTQAARSAPTLPSDPRPSLCVNHRTNCHVVGSTVETTIDLGESGAIIVGAQLPMHYDPSSLELIDVLPGSHCDPDSPFAQAVYLHVNETTGEIIYSVGVTLGGTGTKGPSTLACLRFTVIGSTNSDVCIFSHPVEALLSDDAGNSIAINNTQDCPPETGTDWVYCDRVFVGNSCTCPDGSVSCSGVDDACNVGTCVLGPARCIAVPAHEGGICNDEDECTTTDVCSNGVCVGSGCSAPSLCLTAEMGCQTAGGQLVQIVMGGGDLQIVGAQFSIQFDPNVLTLLNVVPGSQCDPVSPFSMEIDETIDQDAGSLFYASGVGFLENAEGTQGPATVACLFFAQQGNVNSDVCIYSDLNPETASFVSSYGQPVPIFNAVDCPPDDETMLSCLEIVVDEECECMVGTDDCSALSGPCRTGFCDPVTEVCDVENAPEGTLCDDGYDCTTLDYCILGTCKGFFCHYPSLCVDSSEGCIDNDLVLARIVLGIGEPTILGGQFSVSYDPDLLELVSIDPGATCEIESPFVTELTSQSDSSNGTIFYAVGIDPFNGSGTQGPATMACIIFRSLKKERGDICLFNQLNPFTTILVDDTGSAVPIYNVENCPMEDGDQGVTCDHACNVPTISRWGFVVLLLLMLSVAKIRLRRASSVA